jgi:hypothetical protein
MMLLVFFGLLVRSLMAGRTLCIRIESDAAVYYNLLIQKRYGKLENYEGLVPLFLIALLSKVYTRGFRGHLTNVFMVAVGWDLITFFILLLGISYIIESRQLGIQLDIYNTIKIFVLFWLIPTHYVSVRLFSLGFRSIQGTLSAMIFVVLIISQDSMPPLTAIDAIQLLFAFTIVGILNVSASQFSFQNLIFICICFAIASNDGRPLVILFLGLLILFAIDPKGLLVNFSQRFNFFAWYLNYLSGNSNKPVINKALNLKKKSWWINLLNFENPQKQLIAILLWLFCISLVLNYDTEHLINSRDAELFNSVILAAIFLCLLVQFFPGLKVFGESVRYLGSIVLLFPLLLFNELLLIDELRFILILTVSTVFIFLLCVLNCALGFQEIRAGLDHFIKRFDKLWWIDDKAKELHKFITAQELCPLKNLLILPLKYASLVSAVDSISSGHLSSLRNQNSLGLLYNHWTDGNRHIPDFSVARALEITHFVCVDDFFENERLKYSSEIVLKSQCLSLFGGRRLVLARLLESNPVD